MMNKMMGSNVEREEDDLDYRVTADFQGDSNTNTMLKHSNSNSLIEKINLLDDQ